MYIYLHTHTHIPSFVADSFTRHYVYESLIVADNSGLFTIWRNHREDSGIPENVDLLHSEFPDGAAHLQSD